MASIRFSLAQIVQAAGTTLQQTYERLTGAKDTFGSFASLLEAPFPPGVTVDLPNDNPFPLSEVHDVIFEPAKLAGKDVLLSGLVPVFTGVGPVVQSHSNRRQGSAQWQHREHAPDTG